MKYDLEKTTAALNAAPQDAKCWYEQGMALAELDRFEACMEAFTQGLCHSPFDPDLRLQRGRKHITLDQYTQAVADLTLACRLKPQHWENWYYRGVACYMDGRYELAMESQRQCLKTMVENGVEELPAAVCWYWQAAMKAGKRAEAQQILDEYIYEGIPCGNMDYTKRCYLYKGMLKPEDFEDLDRLRESLKDEDRPDLYFITLLHGLATYCYYNGREEQSAKVLRTIYEMPTWHECFAYKQTLQDMKERGLL